MKVKDNAKRFFLFIVLSIFSLLLVQCAIPPSPVFQKDGRIYGRTEGQWGGRWWNYYQRALSYAQGEYWSYAIEDFQEAIEQRPVDQRRARTYGLHLLDDYFPHRELGIVYYQQKRFKEAIAELELSLEQFVSAKAKYFLNLARKGFLEESGIDHLPPEIYIAGPGSGFSTRSSSLKISGRTWDDQYVACISVNKEMIPVELSSRSISFEYDIRLKRGENRILIEAMDLLNQKTDQEIVVWCDQEAPILYIDQIVPDDAGQSFTIEGSLWDMSGVADFSINGESVYLPEDGESSFYMRFTRNDLMKPVMFETEDRLGNQTSGHIDFFETFTGLNNTKLAFAGSDLSGIMSSSTIDLALSDKEGVSKPIIRLKDIPDKLTVDWEAFFIEGEVRDVNGVSGLYINDISLLKRRAKMVFFNFLIPLEVGDNLVTILAESLSGEIETKRIVVRRNLNPARRIGSRLNLAILPFRYRGERQELGSMVYDSLIQSFVEQQRFQIVDREKVDGMIKRLKEKEQEETGGLEIGRLIAAEGVLVGNAYFYDGHMEIIARAIDTETTVIIDSEDVFGPVDSLTDVSSLLDGLALKFKHAFPVIEGKVIGRDSDIVKIDLGQKDLIRPYMKIIFFKDGEPIKLKNIDRTLEKTQVILGEGKIKKVYDQYSDAMVISEGKGLQVGFEDMVITK